VARFKRYLGVTVLEAARARIRYALETFDSYAVAFSGGKDSQVVLHLVREAATELGRLPVPVLFRDEEVIPERVIDHVARYRLEPWARVHWFAVPLKSHAFVLGTTAAYVQWDRARDPSLGGRGWVRPKPPWSILQEPDDLRVFDQYTMDRYAAERMGLRGSVCLFNGMRASEGIVRHRAVMQKLHECWIVSAGADANHVRLAKPVYDWEENDILRYLWESGSPICEAYRAQHLVTGRLRVSTPLHAEAAKRIDALKREDPAFLDAVLRVFPEMGMQLRWWGDFDKEKLLANYGRTWEAIHRYVDRFLTDPAEITLAHERITEAAARFRSSPRGFSPPYVLEEMMAGRYKRPILPLKPEQQKMAKYALHDEAPHARPDV
jgi:predicted phosphoadenosine phosphosulfate sulfurtransferase